jgi:hypothetical protein
MATTTNFGWETPDDTDLVKDGALAIRTLGSAIDTSLVDLKGGTTAQVLSKNSNTDMDFTWVTSDDANAIQNAIVDAKGDLITATAADTPARLAVGTNGQVLTADSTTATGLKWAAGGTNFSGCQVFNSTAVTLTNGAYTTLTFNSETYDIDGYHSTSTNTNRLTVPTGKGGYFWIYGWGQVNAGVSALQATFKLRDSGGNEIARANFAVNTNNEPMLFVNTVRYIADNDWVDSAVYISANANKSFEISGTYGAFGMFRIGA